MARARRELRKERKERNDSGARRMNLRSRMAWRDALLFILDVMNDERLPDNLRDRAAIVALQLVHEPVSPPEEEDFTFDRGLMQ